VTTGPYSAPALFAKLAPGSLSPAALKDMQVTVVAVDVKGSQRGFRLFVCSIRAGHLRVRYVALFLLSCKR
jgi:hypothetical protein